MECAAAPAYFITFPARAKRFTDSVTSYEKEIRGDLYENRN